MIEACSIRLSHLLRPTRALVLASLVTFLATASTYAGSAMWNSSAASGNWDDATNWTPTTIPDSQTDIATFGPSSMTNILTPTKTDVDRITFNADASPYTFTVGQGDVLFTFWGMG